MWFHDKNSYTRLQEEPHEPLIADDENHGLEATADYSQAHTKTPGAALHSKLTTIALVLAMCMNFVLVSVLVWKQIPQPKISKFANLELDQDVPWTHYTPYASTNLTESGMLWDAINWDSGFIALDHSYAEKNGLPKAQPFPWDQDKGIYLINAYHNLHCLKSIHQFIRELLLGGTLSFHMEHIGHCLDSLRLETLCTADDTPRWTSNDPKHTLESGVGQFRKCRDFSKLESWAQQHHSCYARIDELHQCENQMERYKFCPEGSPYQEIMHEYFRVVLDRELPPVVPKESGKPGRCERPGLSLGQETA